MHSARSGKSGGASFAWRLAFSILISLLAIPAIYQSYRIFRADRIVRSGETVDNYTRASQLNPSNALFWWKRGRLHHYSIEKVELHLALQDYLQALELNPRIGQAWMDLADVYERSGKPQKAESALEKAIAVHSYSPLIRWQAGNFYLRQGNLPKMYECFKIACQFDGSKLPIATELVWKIESNRGQILQKLVPDTLPANMGYLNFLAGKDELDLAAMVWRRCLGNVIPPDYEMKPSLAFHYIHRLLAKSRVEEALKVWDEVLAKSGAGLGDARWEKSEERQNLVWNGSFENEILRGGMDWRYPDAAEVQLEVDIEARMDGLKSLRATFKDANVSTGYLHQIVPIFSPGDYELQFYLRTQDLTTDQLPYFAIEGYPDAGCVSARSDFFPPAAPWSRIRVPFVVKEGCKAVRIALARNRSHKFDNKIKGSLWIDGVVCSKQ